MQFTIALWSLIMAAATAADPRQAARMTCGVSPSFARVILGRPAKGRIHA
jgi:hypothetical protein